MPSSSQLIRNPKNKTKKIYYYSKTVFLLNYSKVSYIKLISSERFILVYKF